MKKLIELFIAVLPAIFVCSCAGVMDKAPDGTLTMEEILKDPYQVEALLNSCYKNIPTKGYNYHMHCPLPTCTSDEGWSSDEGQGGPVGRVYNFANSASSHKTRDAWNSSADGTPKDANGWNGNCEYWNRFWTQIHLCNQFLEVIPEAAVRSEEMRSRMTAEAHLLRAFFYSELIKWFGKLPVIDTVLPNDYDYSQLKRQPVYEVVQLICSDCDAAIACPDLPWRITDPEEAGRMNKALAYTLKGVMLMFAASPLFNEGEDHWEEAYQACKTAVTELKANGYELFTTCTEKSTFEKFPEMAAGSAFHQLACRSLDYSGDPVDKETIYEHYTYIDGRVWHIGFIGNESGAYKVETCPTQELVDAFETIDGQPILDLEKPYLDDMHLQPNFNKANTLYDEQNPYANRDPRFYSTVMTNGQKFIWNNVTYTFEPFEGGRHEISLTKSERKRTRTGYIARKFIDPLTCQNHDVRGPCWQYYRLGELLLDFAECACESGHLGEAKAAVDEVRARVGMPAIPGGMDKAGLRLRIHAERRVELAWEENRYFDLRRWCKPDGDMYETCAHLTGMRPIKQGDGSFKYERYAIQEAARGGYENRDLSLPLPTAEAARKETATGVNWQNPGW